MESNKAQWLINPDGWYPYCSNCKHEPKNGVMSKYCPECGSLMIQEESTNRSTMKQLTVLSEQNRKDIHYQIEMALKELNAFPESCYKGWVQRRITRVGEILETQTDRIFYSGNGLDDE